MKKIIIAAAIVCAAALSQAAVVNWSIGSGKTAVKLNGTTLTAQNVSLYLVGINDASDMLFDERATGTSLSAGKLSPNKGTMQTNSGIKYNSTDIAGGGFFDDGDLGREYYIVITATGSDDKTYTYTSSAVASSGLTATQLGSVDFAFNDTISTVAGTKDAWVSAVPEPTSGLLMLLGVAGLALRRRRA